MPEREPAIAPSQASASAFEPRAAAPGCSGAESPYEVCGDPRAGGPFVFTCEHAGNELFEWRAQPADWPLLADHWGWDIGAADLVRALAARLRCCAVLARFSRLICDP